MPRRTRAPSRGGGSSGSGGSSDRPNRPRSMQLIPGASAAFNRQLYERRRAEEKKEMAEAANAAAAAAAAAVTSQNERRGAMTEADHAAIIRAARIFTCPSCPARIGEQEADESQEDDSQEGPVDSSQQGSRVDSQVDTDTQGDDTQDTTQSRNCHRPSSRQGQHLPRCFERLGQRQDLVLSTQCGHIFCADCWTNEKEIAADLQRGVSGCGDGGNTSSAERQQQQQKIVGHCPVCGVPLAEGAVCTGPASIGNRSGGNSSDIGNAAGGEGGTAAPSPLPAYLANPSLWGAGLLNVMLTTSAAASSNAGGAISSDGGDDMVPGTKWRRVDEVTFMLQGDARNEDGDGDTKKAGSTMRTAADDDHQQNMDRSSTIRATETTNKVVPIKEEEASQMYTMAAGDLEEASHLTSRDQDRATNQQDATSTGTAEGQRQDVSQSTAGTNGNATDAKSSHHIDQASQETTAAGAGHAAAPAVTSAQAPSQPLSAASATTAASASHTGKRKTPSPSSADLLPLEGSDDTDRSKRQVIRRNSHGGRVCFGDTSQGVDDDRPNTTGAHGRRRKHRRLKGAKLSATRNAQLKKSVSSREKEVPQGDTVRVESRGRDAKVTAGNDSFDELSFRSQSQKSIPSEDVSSLTQTKKRRKKYGDDDDGEDEKRGSSPCSADEGRVQHGSEDTEMPDDGDTAASRDKDELNFRSDLTVSKSHGHDFFSRDGGHESQFEHRHTDTPVHDDAKDDQVLSSTTKRPASKRSCCAEANCAVRTDPASNVQEEGEADRFFTAKSQEEAVQVQEVDTGKSSHSNNPGLAAEISTPSPTRAKRKHKHIAFETYEEVDDDLIEFSSPSGKLVKRRIDHDHKPIPVGILVRVASRTFPGSNKQGGIGQVKGSRGTMETNDLVYDVKYVLSGRECDIPCKYVVLNEAFDDCQSSSTPRLCRTRKAGRYVSDREPPRTSPRLRRSPRTIGTPTKVAKDVITEDEKTDPRSTTTTFVVAAPSNAAGHANREEGDETQDVNREAEKAFVRSDDDVVNDDNNTDTCIQESPILLMEDQPTHTAGAAPTSQHDDDEECLPSSAEQNSECSEALLASQALLAIRHSPENNVPSPAQMEQRHIGSPHTAFDQASRGAETANDDEYDDEETQLPYPRDSEETPGATPCRPHDEGVSKKTIGKTPIGTDVRSIAVPRATDKTKSNALSSPIATTACRLLAKFGAAGDRGVTTEEVAKKQLEDDGSTNSCSVVPETEAQYCQSPALLQTEAAEAEHRYSQSPILQPKRTRSPEHSESHHQEDDKVHEYCPKSHATGHTLHSQEGQDSEVVPGTEQQGYSQQSPESEQSRVFHFDTGATSRNERLSPASPPASPHSLPRAQHPISRKGQFSPSQESLHSEQPYDFTTREQSEPSELAYLPSPAPSQQSSPARGTESQLIGDESQAASPDRSVQSNGDYSPASYANTEDSLEAHLRYLEHGTQTQTQQPTQAMASSPSKASSIKKSNAGRKGLHVEFDMAAKQSTAKKTRPTRNPDTPATDCTEESTVIVNPDAGPPSDDEESVHSTQEVPATQGAEYSEPQLGAMYGCKAGDNDDESIQSTQEVPATEGAEYSEPQLWRDRSDFRVQKTRPKADAVGNYFPQRQGDGDGDGGDDTSVQSTQEVPATCPPPGYTEPQVECDQSDLPLGDSPLTHSEKQSQVGEIAVGQDEALGKMRRHGDQSDDELSSDDEVVPSSCPQSSSQYDSSSMPMPDSAFESIYRHIKEAKEKEEQRKLRRVSDPVGKAKLAADHDQQEDDDYLESASKEKEDPRRLRRVTIENAKSNEAAGKEEGGNDVYAGIDGSEVPAVTPHPAGAVRKNSCVDEAQSGSREDNDQDGPETGAAEKSFVPTKKGGKYITPLPTTKDNASVNNEVDEMVDRLSQNSETPTKPSESSINRCLLICQSTSFNEKEHGAALYLQDIGACHITRSFSNFNLGSNICDVFFIAHTRQMPSLSNRSTSSSSDSGPLLVCDRSFDYLLALSTGMPIISASWLVDCADKKKWLDQDLYKVWGDSRTYALFTSETPPDWLQAPRSSKSICRQAIVKRNVINKGAREPLLSSFAVVILADAGANSASDEFSSKQLLNLTVTNGGTVVKNRENARWRMPSSSTKRIVIVPDSLERNDEEIYSFFIPRIINGSIFPDSARIHLSADNIEEGCVTPLTGEDHNKVSIVRASWLLDSVAATEAASLRDYCLGCIRWDV